MDMHFKDHSNATYYFKEVILGFILSVIGRIDFNDSYVSNYQFVE